VALFSQRENLATSSAPTAVTPPPGAHDESRRLPHHHRLQSLRLHRRLIQRNSFCHMAAIKTVNFHLKPSKAPPRSGLGATEGQRHRLRHLA
jgi:hypothetical protein